MSFDQGRAPELYDEDDPPFALTRLWADRPLRLSLAKAIQRVAAIWGQIKPMALPLGRGPVQPAM